MRKNKKDETIPSIKELLRDIPKLSREMYGRNILETTFYEDVYELMLEYEKNRAKKNGHKMDESLVHRRTMFVWGFMHA